MVRDVGSSVGWPTLTKTNYVEWAGIMKVRLQVRRMWEAVQDSNVDHLEDRRALDALIAAVPPEMQFSLSNKRTAKEAWDAIAAARIGSDRARKSTLQALRKEWENLGFKPGEDVDDFALRLNTLLQKMVKFGDATYTEERAVEKLFRCIPEKYKQMARSIESLLDLSTMTIEEAIGRLKVVDTDEPQPPSGPVTTGGKLLLTREQWDPSLGDRKKGEPSSRAAARVASSVRREEAPRAGHKDVPKVTPVEAPRTAPLASPSRHKTTVATTVAGLAIGPMSVGNHDKARLTSHRRRRRRRLCSWRMQALSYPRRLQSQRLSSTSMSQKHMLFSAMAPGRTRLRGGASTPAPPTT